MALKGWRGNGLCMWNTTPEARRDIESGYAKRILSGEADTEEGAQAMIKQIKADDLETKVVRNLILNIRLRRQDADAHR